MTRDRAIDLLGWAAFALACSAFVLPVVNPDIYWHLSAGKYTVAHLAPPRADFLSWPLHGQEWVDFEPANHLNATHPGAIFVQKRVLVRHHPAGRDILLGDQLKTFHHGVVHTRAVPPEELQGALNERFGLAVPA